MMAQCSLHMPYVRHWPFQTRYNRCITLGFALSDGVGNDCTTELQGFFRHGATGSDVSERSEGIIDVSTFLPL